MESTVSSILDSIPILVVGTNLGISLINVRTREVITALSFNHMFQQSSPLRSNYVSSSFSRPHKHCRQSTEDKNDGIFGSMISQLIFGSDEHDSFEKDDTGCSHEANHRRNCQKIIIMGQRTSDAKSFALTLNIQSNCSKSFSRNVRGVSYQNDVESRRPSAKSQNLPFSVVAQAPAKRGSLFENMQRKLETMKFGNTADVNGNPTTLLHQHGGPMTNGGRRMKLSTSVPNLDKKETVQNKNKILEDPPSSSIERNTSNGRNIKTSTDINKNNVKTNKLKSSGYGKIYEKIKMFEPNLNPSGKKRSSSTSQATRRKNVGGGGLVDNPYYNSNHGHTPALNRNQQKPISTERDTLNHKGNESNDGKLLFCLL